MAIWDNFGKKASETTAKAMQKAKDMAEITRLNSLISDEEHKMNDIYNQIGKRYVSLHATDCEIAFSELIVSLHQSERQVQELQQQIQEIKGVQRCAKCGAEIPLGTAFCSSCGSPVVSQMVGLSPVGFLRCSHCGDLVKMGMRFCTSCGAPLQQQETMQTVSAPKPEPETENATIGSVCPNCGSQLQEGLVFCTECGTRIQEETISFESESEKVTELVCSNCGARLQESVTFCIECGARLQQETVQNESELEPKEPTGPICPGCRAQLQKDVDFCTECGVCLRDSLQPELKEKKGAFCPTCGAKLDADSIFCSGCGAKLKEYQNI